MALKRVIAKLEDVAEALRGEYTAAADGTFVLAVDGIEDVSGLKSTLQKVRDEAETARKALKAFEGLDPVAARKMMAAMGNNEELKLIADGKWEEVFERRTAAMRADYDTKLKAVTDANEAVGKKTTKLQHRLLLSSLRTAAIAAGVHKEAIGDAEMQGMALFSVNDDGDVIMMRDGNPVLGKDGKTPISPEEWAPTLRETKPHYFPATGGGSGGTQDSGNAGSKQNVMKRSVWEGLDADNKAKHFASGGTLIDD